MKKIILCGIVIFAIVLWSCKSQATDNRVTKDSNAVSNDTIRIANDELEYEILIIDPGFNGWLYSNARPRNFYSQEYMENRNLSWVNDWNSKALQNSRYGNLFEMQINYQPGIDYGYEVNYMLFNYLTYFQLTNKIKLGSYPARI